MFVFADSSVSQYFKRLEINTADKSLKVLWNLNQKFLKASCCSVCLRLISEQDTRESFHEMRKNAAPCVRKRCKHAFSRKNKILSLQKQQAPAASMDSRACWYVFQCHYLEIKRKWSHYLEISKLICACDKVTFISSSWDNRKGWLHEISGWLCRTWKWVSGLFFWVTSL